MAIPGFSSITKTVSGLFSKGSSPSSGTAYDLLDPSNARRAISGILPGGMGGLGKQNPNVGFQGSGASTATAPSEDDWRVRVSLADGAQIFYKDPSVVGNGIMAPLIETNGVIWPYTPSIQVSHTANYTPQPLTHSNYTAHFYNNSEVSDITISGDFTVQSAEEGQYLMAAIYFFRSATKMFFGQGANAGNPPPIVFLDGYGSHYFPHVPCVITNFTHQLGNEVDYIEVPISKTSLEEVAVQPDNQNIGSVQLSATEQKYVPSLLQSGKAASKTKMQYSTITSTTRVPTTSQITVTLRPVYSRKNQHERFNLDDFAQGKLLGDKINGFGGFL
jgi:hypothetical protein